MACMDTAHIKMNGKQEMNFECKDTIAILALGISSLNLLLYYLDIKPTLKVGFYLEDAFPEDNEVHPTTRTKYYSIDIVNHSSRRIKVANISLEWTTSRWLVFRKKREIYQGFQKGKSNDYLSSFWIEPWGDISLSVEEDNLTAWFWERTHYSKHLWARIVVTDALGKHYKSRKLKI